jgi:hypothetical protein
MILLFLALVPTTSGGESPLIPLISGYWKSTALRSREPIRSAAGHRDTLTNSTSLRLNAGWEMSDALAADLSYQISAEHLHLTTPATEVRPAYRIGDPDPVLHEDRLGSSGLHANRLLQNLDRASLSYAHDGFDLILGRQAIGFGSARSVNPTDILIPFPLLALDTEDRQGVDALRILKPLGEKGEVDLGLVAGHHGEGRDSAAFLSLRRPLGEWDTVLTLMTFQEHRLIGIDTQGSLGNAGVWLEAAWVELDDAPQHTARRYLRASLGADHKITEDKYIYLEYHFSGAGTDEPAAYRQRAIGPAHSEGGVFLLGRHYLTPGVAWQLNPLLNTSGSAMINLNDGSTLLSSRLEWNLREDWYLDLGAFLGLGRPPIRTGTGSLIDRSEFGSYHDSLWLTLRYYF